MRLTDFLQNLGSPVVYYPQLAKLLGGVKEAIFLCHIIYWMDKGGNENGIFKTQEELTEETGLSRSEQESARKRLKALGLLSEYYARLEHRLYFKVDLDRLNELWDATFPNAGFPHSGMQESSIRECRKPAFDNKGIQRLHTEITYRENNNRDLRDIPEYKGGSLSPVADSQPQFVCDNKSSRIERQREGNPPSEGKTSFGDSRTAYILDDFYPDQYRKVFNTDPVFDRDICARRLQSLLVILDREYSETESLAIVEEVLKFAISSACSSPELIPYSSGLEEWLRPGVFKQIQQDMMEDRRDSSQQEDLGAGKEVPVCYRCQRDLYREPHYQVDLSEYGEARRYCPVCIGWVNVPACMLKLIRAP